jgi:hypothetical protein
MLFVVLASVSAAGSRVLVMKLNYDNGNISLVNDTIKYGFSPDRRYQPEYGYKAEIVSFDGEVVYDFRFKKPNEIFVDGTDENGEISGGKIVLDEVNFALSVPYFEDMKEINFYSDSDEFLGRVSFEEKRELLIWKWWITGLIIIVTLVLLILIITKYKK